MPGGAIRVDPANQHISLEVCIDDANGLRASCEGGADRVELCSALELGGLTPSAGLMERALDAGISAMALIRLRAGGFVYSSDEMNVMLQDIKMAREIGITGVVVGAANADGTLNIDVLERMCEAAGSLDVTLHRVFDLTPDPEKAINQAVDLGISRILTSGQKVSVADGIETLAVLSAYAGSRISIMPGAGIKPENVTRIVEQTGASEVHTSCGSRSGEVSPELVAFGFADKAPRKQASSRSVREMRELLDAITTQKSPQKTGKSPLEEQAGSYEGGVQ
jgi:copper homeostasis protein